ncbi:MAG: AIM24 family protein [Roseburia sp.]|nr:AIM24 family protein [Roseburia sp.]
MSYRVSNFIGDNENLDVIERKGPFTVFQHLSDLSVVPQTAQTKFYMSQMACTPKQLYCECSGGVKTQAGAMQVMFGNVEQTTGIKGAGDLLGKMVKGKVTGESTVKPEYIGSGTMLCEPTYKHLLIEDLEDWNGALACDDGMFFAAEACVKDSVQMRSNISSVAGGKGLFNYMAKGTGCIVLESWCPREELYVIDIKNDVVKVDGSNVVCWSGGLQFTVERSGKTLIGSAVGGEGLVNVYRGTGRLLMAPRT